MLSAVGDQSRLLSKLDKLRLLVAKEVNCHCLDHQTDRCGAPAGGYINEVCDQYALQIVLDWLAGERNFPLNGTMGSSALNTTMSRLSSYPFLRDRYPFSGYLDPQAEEKIY